MFSQVAILENVLGIEKVLGEVKAHLQSELPEYQLALHVLDPPVA